MNKPEHHVDGKFKNLYPFDRPSFSDLMKWRRERSKKDIPDADSYNFPMAENDPSFLQSNRTQNTLTWIGHATLLLQINGINILTDPHFSKRASPVQWAGPERTTPPGIAIKDLPPIDLVLISHSHYDHLDNGSIKKLLKQQPNTQPTFAVPLKLKSWFEKRGAKSVIELDWWQSRTQETFKVTALPVQHWSKRNVFTENDTLWAGWLLEIKGFRFFFAGDTGYAPLFKELGKSHGPFDLCAIPVGAYEPRWFMKSQHVDPREALSMHQDLGCKRSVGIHWGTFVLTDEPLDEPVKRIKELRPELGITEEEFFLLQHGETRMLD